MAVLSLPMPWRWAVPISSAALLSIEAMIGRVGMWRGGVRSTMSVAAPFVWRCLSRLLKKGCRICAL